MKKTPTEYTPPKHVRWRKIGESVTSHYTNTQRKDVFIDPCECIKKLFDAAKAAVDKVPKQDEVFGGSQRAAAMRTVRGINQFRAHFRAYEYAKTCATIYENSVPPKWRIATQAQVKECGLKSEADLVLRERDSDGNWKPKRIRLQVGAHRIEITPGGGIELFSPQALHALTGSVSFQAAKAAVPVSVETALAPDFSGKFQVKDKDTGKILAHKNYRIKTPQGKYFHGTTDANGYTQAVGGIQSAIFDIQIES